jgi:hypothetical protein
MVAHLSSAYVDGFAGPLFAQSDYQCMHRAAILISADSLAIAGINKLVTTTTDAIC